MYDSYADIFAERGRAYHAAMAEFPRARDAEFQAVVAALPVGATGLLCDLPAGGAYLAAHLPGGLDYIGVDPSDDFIAACPPKVRCVKGDLDSVPLAAASADVVVSLAALHHAPDLDAAFGEIRRLLKPGGTAIIADAEDGTAAARFLNGFVDRHNPMGHDGRFFDGQTRSRLGRAGFEVRSDALTDVPWRFGTVEEAGAFCRSLFWMPELSAAEVGEALDREIGFDRGEGVSLRWALRYLVATAV